METDTDKKYKEILHDEKKEVMKWDFEDFLKQTEVEKPIKIQKKSGSILPKIYWMAASLVLLVTMFFGYQQISKNNLSETDQLVKNEIQKQKAQELQTSMAQNTVSVAENDSLKTEKKDSVRESNQAQEKDVLDQILPKRGRIRKSVRSRYVQNTVKTLPRIAFNKKASEKNKDSEYSENYVIINGQKITDEKEAIDITKYSFQILANNVNQTLEQTDVIKNLNIDF